MAAGGGGDGASTTGSLAGAEVGLHFAGDVDGGTGEKSSKEKGDGFFE